MSSSAGLAATGPPARAAAGRSWVCRLFLTVLAPLLVTGWAEAQTLRDPGEAFIPHKKPGNFGPDYYVVRKGNNGKCSIVPGDLNDKPVGVVGGTPYASSNMPSGNMQRLRSNPLPNAKAGWPRTLTNSLKKLESLTRVLVRLDVVLLCRA